MSAIIAAAFLVGCDDGSAAAAGQADPQVEILATDAVSVAGSQGTYTTRHDGTEVRIGFPVPAERVDPIYFHFAERIGATGDVAVVLDTYGSGAGGGERCATERESWVRAFSLRRKDALAAQGRRSVLDAAGVLIDLARDAVADGVGREVRRQVDRYRWSPLRWSPLPRLF